jgi:hypothetical protein
MDSILVRVGLLLLLLSGAVYFIWFCIVWGRSGEFDETTLAMGRTPRRRWSQQQLEKGDVIGALDLKVWGRARGLARWVLLVGSALVVVGLVINWIS